MKKTIAFILAALSAALLLCSCSAKPECRPEAAVAALGEAENVPVCLYSDSAESTAADTSDEASSSDKSGASVLPVIPDGAGLAALLKGEWTECSGTSLGNKKLSITVATQYEICLFDSGKAMIYYGYCGIFEKDRQYYTVSLDSGLDAVLEYVRQNSIKAPQDQ